MGASLTCGKWSEPPRSGYNTLFDQNLLCYEEGILYYYRSSTETITQSDWLCHEIYSKQNNRVLKCDVIKMQFLKLWDLSGYSEKTMSKRPTCQK